MFLRELRILPSNIESRIAIVIRIRFCCFHGWRLGMGFDMSVIDTRIDFYRIVY